MRKRWFRICLFVLLSMTIFAGCSKNTNENDTINTLQSGGSSSSEVIYEGGEPMTLMVYMVGSDLEAATAAATKDMQEMEASGIDLANVNLLVYAGGSPKWHNAELNVSSEVHSVFKLTEDGFTKLEEYELASMGDPACLTKFLEYGYTNYPSSTYGLILWDHGNGPVMGYGSDILYGNDALTLPEIETALEASPFGIDNKLEFIGFDACLMASVELACMVDDYADYLVASQEVEPGFGWNYAFLEACAKADVPTLLEVIVDHYVTYSKDYFEKNPFFKSEVTLAVADLSYAQNIESALNQLFGVAAEAVSENFNQLALDRVETRAFGRATTGSEYDLVDLRHLMDSMQENFDDEVEEVIRILDQMIVYNDSNTAKSCGLSLYYPYYNKKYYEASWKTSYAELGLLPNYVQYLEGYEEIWLGTDMKEYFAGRLVANEAGSGVYTLALNDEQNERFADAGFYILKKMGEDGYSVVYYSQNVTNESGVLKARFDGNVLYYGNDLGDKAIPVARALDEVDGVSRYVLFPSLTGSVDDFLTSEDLTCRLVVSVDPKTKEVSVLDFSESSDEEIQTGKREQVNLEEWVRIRFFEIKSRYLTRDEDGRILNYWEWPEGDWIIWNELALADGLTFTYEPIYDDGEEYYLMFNLMDVQGNQYSSELFPITLEEAPPVEEKTPTDAGTLEGSSQLICEQDNVRIYLDLVKDTALRQTSYCFRVENENDFPVRVQIQDMIIDEVISCTDALGYLNVEPHQTGYDFMSEISTICMIEDKTLAESLAFKVRMNNTQNDKTLIYDEPFVVHISKDAQPTRIFIPYLGAAADDQLLVEASEGISVSLLGAGYELNSNNMNPDGEYADFKGILRFENTSESVMKIDIENVVVNQTAYPASYMFNGYKNQMVLEPGQVYSYEWEVDNTGLKTQNVDQISDVTIQFKTSTENGSKDYNLQVNLKEDTDDETKSS